MLFRWEVGVSRRPCHLLERVIHDGQLSDANARCGEDGTGECRRDGWCSGLACAAQWRITFLDVHFDGGTVGEARHSIVGEVALYHGAVSDRNLATQRCAQTKNDPALELRSEAIRIDRYTTVRSSCDALN